jgi:hypothetical protein
MRHALPLIILAAVSAPALANGVRFEARVPSDTTTLDQQFELTVTLERDGNQVFESYRAPSIPDFDLLHTGTSEQMQMSFINGRQSVRVVEVHQYVLKARKRGSFTIGPATVKVNGQQLTTKPIVMHINAAPKGAIVNPPVTPNGPVPPPESARGDEDLFIDARLDKPKVYVGEQITAVWRLYTQSDILKYRSLTEPKHEDFWSEDLFVPGGHLGWDRQIVKGREFAVALLLKKALFPLKAGKLTITPLESESTTMQSAFYANASAVRRSSPLSVEVLPLPVEGRPPGFESTNVGQLQLVGTVDRFTVKAGEAITWKLTLKGTGNLRNARLPRIDKLDGWKVFDPTAKENVEKGDPIRGEKTYTYLLMPARGGTLTIPEISLPYFDPSKPGYAVSKSAPVTITVEGDPTKVAQSNPGSAQENVLSQQIRTIRNKKTVRSRIGEALFRGRLATVALAAPPAVWILVLIADGLRRRLARETAGSKKRRARRAARKRMRVAEYHIKAQRPSAFFGECARVIYEHLEYRVGQKVESLTLAELRTFLTSRGFTDETTESIVKELENCDFARFAPSASGPGEMRAALRRVKTLLSWIETAKIASDVKEAA